MAGLRRGGAAVSFIGVFVAMVSCGSDRAPEDVPGKPPMRLEEVRAADVLVESSAARLRIRAIRSRARSRSVIGDGLVARFEASAVEPAGWSDGKNRAKTHARALVSPSGSPGGVRPASVWLPRRAVEAVRIEETTSGVAVAFVLDDMRDASLEVADGLAIYARGYAGIADVVHRVTEEGTEDFVVFDKAPPVPQLTYRVDVTKVAGLRLVTDTLELLDDVGTPQLRVAPPYVVDASDVRYAAILTVSGCAVDRDPAGPWGRRVTPPGARTCKVSVSWPRGIAYPAVVDPSWTTTGSMKAARQSHAGVRLASGKVLVAGGFGGAYLASAEIYDPATGTWASTGTMNAIRMGHSANLLASGKVLVTGGRDSTQYTSSAELFDPALGTFTLTPPMTDARGSHTASTLASGKVLVAGGLDPSVVATAEVYDPVANTFTAVGSMGTPREHHTASVLASGKVLVVGGTTGASAFASAELFDPVAKTFSPTGSLVTGRYFHRATVLASGTVLVTGGQNLGYLASAELFDPATAIFTATGSMAVGRLDHTSTLLLPSGKVLIAGGETSGPVLATAELYDPLAGTFSSAGIMAAAREWHTATQLPSGKLLVAGGSDGSATPSSELFLVLAGGTCTIDADCGSGVCQDGVCCAGACSGACVTCTAGAGGCVMVTSAEDPDTCAGANICDAAGVCKLKLAQPCPGGASTCLSGFCADGYCCDTACSGACDSCNLPAKLGTCSPAPVGSPGANPACAAGLCDGIQTACATVCATDTRCASSLYCAAKGTCEPRKAQGTACNMATDCKGASCRVCTTGSCIDGVCCDTACTGACEACAAALKESGKDGTCGPAKEGSAPLRGVCPDDGPASCARDGKCSGTGGCRQSYPGGSLCGAPGSCTDLVATLATSCDGNGTCIPGVTKKCLTYACGVTACNESCASTAECAPGSTCDTAAHKCISGASCDGQHTATDVSGAQHDCKEYRCESNGTCKESCSSVDDCVAPTQCDQGGKCVLPAADDSGGCSTTPRSLNSAPSPHLVLLGVGVLALLRRRGRRRRDSVCEANGGEQ